MKMVKFHGLDFKSGALTACDNDRRHFIEDAILTEPFEDRIFLNDDYEMRVRRDFGNLLGVAWHQHARSTKPPAVNPLAIHLELNASSYGTLCCRFDSKAFPWTIEQCYDLY